MNKIELKGALTDPCPVCGLKAYQGVNVSDDAPTPREGAILICFGCALVSIVHDGMSCALTQEEADYVFSRLELIENIAQVARLRSMQPWRTAELVRQQAVDAWKERHPDKPCPDCGETIKGAEYGQRLSWPLCPCGYPHK